MSRIRLALGWATAVIEDKTGVGGNHAGHSLIAPDSRSRGERVIVPRDGSIVRARHNRYEMSDATNVEWNRQGYRLARYAQMNWLS